MPTETHTIQQQHKNILDSKQKFVDAVNSYILKFTFKTDRKSTFDQFMQRDVHCVSEKKGPLSLCLK